MIGLESYNWKKGLRTTPGSLYPSKGTRLEEGPLPTPPEVSWLPCFSWPSCEAFQGWGLWNQRPPEVGSPCSWQSGNYEEWRWESEVCLGHSTSYQSELWFVPLNLPDGRLPAPPHRSQQFQTRTSWQVDCLSGWDPRSSSRRCSGTRVARPWPTLPPGESLGWLRWRRRPRLSSGCLSHPRHH